MDLKRLYAELSIEPGAVCEHDGPASVSAALGGYYARCARCGPLGPVREDPEGARRALLECGPTSRSEENQACNKRRKYERGESRTTQEGAR